MQHRHQARNDKGGGFSLIEVLVVLAVLGFIVVMVVPQLLGRQGGGIDQTRLRIKSLENVLELYALDHSGKKPTTAEGLDFLLNQPDNDSQWHGPYLIDKTVPVDEWGQPFQYEYPGQHHHNGKEADISSGGPDREFGTPDDIHNW
jgi:general secretion pathway protein G